MAIVIDSEHNVKCGLFEIKKRIKQFKEMFPEKEIYITNTEHLAETDLYTTIPVIHPDSEKAAFGTVVCAALFMVSTAVYLFWIKFV